VFAPADAGEALEAAVAWMASLPGATVRATGIAIVPDDEAAAQMLPAMAFDHEELVSCHVAGPMRIWSDFRIGAMAMAAC
jgi:hypothetical protein